MPRSFRPIAILLLTSVLTACAGLKPPWRGVPANDLQAESLFRSGDYEGATRRYEYLARTTPFPDYYWLQAADAALRGGDGKSAQQLVDGINPRELEGQDRNQYFLLASRLDLNAGRAQEAAAKLDSLRPEWLEGGQRINYHTLRASAYNQSGDMLACARERVVLDGLLTQPEAIQKNREAIYDALGRLPDPVLAGRQPPPPDILGGWMALTRILKTTPAGKLSALLDDWRGRYSGHPADGAFLQKAVAEAGGTVRVTPLGKPQTAPKPPQQPPAPPAPPPTGPFIGVLLPLSGPYATASTAIRSGIVAAHDADPDPAKLPLHFVDSGSGNVRQTYRTLVEQGAKAVVGPLLKENVTALAKSGALPIPVLALNQTAEAENQGLYQFGLTPEHEVEQSAGSAWFDGHQNALVLAPATQFGQRMLKHFIGYWRSLGGRVAAVKTYPQHGQDPTPVVKALLDAAPADGGFVFLIADPQDARSIMPRIIFGRGSPVPVYATSHVYNGKVDPRLNQELNGLIFCDIPWLLNTGDGGPLSTHAMEARIGQTPPDYVKLIALGLDAYRLLPEMERLKTDPEYQFPGATGSLSLQSGNRVRRQLECARFEGGNAQSRGVAPMLKPGSPAAAKP